MDRFARLLQTDQIDRGCYEAMFALLVLGCDSAHNLTTIARESFFPLVTFVAQLGPNNLPGFRSFPIEDAS